MTNSALLFGLHRLLPLAVGLFLVACGSASDKGTSALYDAVEGNDLGRVRRLLQQGADPNDHIRYTLFVLAIHEGSHFWDHDNGKTALMVASEKGSVPIVTALLDAGANPNRGTRIRKTALMYAAENCQLDVMKLLVSKNADVTAVATDAANKMADWSGSVLRFALECTKRDGGTSDIVRFILNHLKPGDVSEKELSLCLGRRYERVPADVKQRI